jgi:transposase
VSEDEEMKTHRHRRHSIEFKLRIVQAYLNGEESMKGIARQHDISHNLLRIWLEKFRRGELTEEGDRKERIREYEVKVGALERKVGQLTMEIDLLKKLQQGPGRKKRSHPLSAVPRPFRRPRVPCHEPLPEHLLQGVRQGG